MEPNYDPLVRHKRFPKKVNYLQPMLGPKQIRLPGTRSKNQTLEKIKAKKKVGKSNVYTDWVHECQHNIVNFSSLVIQIETKLQHAKIFTSNLSKPNELEIVVACECFDELVPVMGRFENALKSIKDILYAAIFSAETRNDTSYENSSDNAYIGRNTYFGILDTKLRQSKERRDGVRHAQDRDFLIERMNALSVEDLQGVLYKLLPRVAPENVGWILASDHGAEKWHRAILEPLTVVGRLKCITKYAQDHFTSEDQQRMITSLEEMSPSTVKRNEGGSKQLLPASATKLSIARFLRLFACPSKDMYIDGLVLAMNVSDKEEKQNLASALEILQTNRTFWFSIASFVEKLKEKTTDIEVRKSVLLDRRWSKSIKLERKVSRLKSTSGISPEEVLEKSTLDSSTQTDLISRENSRLGSLISCAVVEGSKLSGAPVNNRRAAQTVLSIVENETKSNQNSNESVKKLLYQGERRLEEQSIDGYIEDTVELNAIERIPKLYQMLADQNAKIKQYEKRFLMEGAAEKSKVIKNKFQKARLTIRLGLPTRQAYNRTECGAKLVEILIEKISQNDNDDRDFQTRTVFPAYFKTFFNKTSINKEDSAHKYDSLENAIERWSRVDNRIRVFGQAMGIVPFPFSSKTFTFSSCSDFLILALRHLLTTTKALRGTLMSAWQAKEPDMWNLQEAKIAVQNIFSGTFTGAGCALFDLQSIGESIPIFKIVEIVMKRRMEQEIEEEIAKQNIIDQHQKTNTIECSFTMDQWCFFMMEHDQSLDADRCQLLWGKYFGEKRQEINRATFVAFLEFFLRNRSIKSRAQSR